MENNKKLERDTQHKVIGGVCSGLANYFDVDVVLLRVLLACMLVFAGAGSWLYVILWVVIPAAKTGVVTDETRQSVMDSRESNHVSKGALAIGLLLILAGALGLLHRFVPAFNWHTIWPVLLIVLGILLLFPSKNK